MEGLDGFVKREGVPFYSTISVTIPTFIFKKLENGESVFNSIDVVDHHVELLPWPEIYDYDDDLLLQEFQKHQPKLSYMYWLYWKNFQANTVSLCA